MTRQELVSKIPAELGAQYAALFSQIPEEHHDEAAAFLHGLQQSTAIPWAALLSWAMSDGMPLILAVFSHTVTLAQIQKAVADLLAIVP